MSVSSLATSVVRTALFAVALSACAHQSAQLAQTTPSHLGGRDAGGFNASAPAAFEQTPSPLGESYLGGQAGQPHAWLGSETRSVVLVEPSCLAAGRAAQPFSGPSLYSATPTDPNSAACTSHAPTHF
jgi:hypothetical protein